MTGRDTTTGAHWPWSVQPHDPRWLEGDLRNRIPRIVVLVVALCWLAHLSASVFQAQRRGNDEIRAIDARVSQVELDRANAAVAQEARLMRIETQLAQLNDTAGKVAWSVVGTMLLVILNALMGLVIRKPKE